MSDPIKNRYEFVVLFDVENGNPNGDPDAGNMPRVDPETGYGLVTDVCLKRKIRNYVEMAKEGEKGYRIYIKDGVPLNSSDKEACAYVGADPDKLKEAKKKDEHLDEKIRDFMCSNFYDIRTFGAVMTTFTKGALNCGQVRGPVQLGFARSIDPILPQEVTITRVAITTEADAEKKNLDFFNGGLRHKDHDRGGRGKEEHRNGPQVHRALRSLPRGGLCVGESRAQDDRLFGRGPRTPVDGYFEHV